MAKLNAKISSERPSRTISKSGNEYINIELNSSIKEFEINFTPEYLEILGGQGNEMAKFLY